MEYLRQFKEIVANRRSEGKFPEKSPTIMSVAMQYVVCDSILICLQTTASLVVEQ